MNDLTPNTEPIIRYNEGTVQINARFGSLALHDFSQSTGLQHVAAAESSIFLVGCYVATIDVWQGVPQRLCAYEPGDIAFLPAGTSLSTSYVSRPYNETMVRIPHGLLDRAGDELPIPNRQPEYRVFRKSSTLGLAAVVQHMARADVLPLFDGMLAESIALALAMKLVRLLAGMADADEPIDGLSPRRRDHALQFIEANLDQPITLDMIASAAALSPFHFARAFKVSMGISPVRYVWQRRIELARQLLKDRNYALSQVALACGFSNQSHFTTAFKEATGLTPAVYRAALS